MSSGSELNPAQFCILTPCLSLTQLGDLRYSSANSLLTPFLPSPEWLRNLLDELFKAEEIK